LFLAGSLAAYINLLLVAPAPNLFLYGTFSMRLEYRWVGPDFFGLGLGFGFILLARAFGGLEKFTE
jgi:hypothetical protein